MAKVLIVDDEINIRGFLKNIIQAEGHDCVLAGNADEAETALNRAAFEPDLLMIYGNPAQVMRLIQGALYSSGGAVTSSAMGRLGCASIITVMNNDECRYVVPGNGDRVFGMTQDWEMAFLIPASKIDTVIDGMAKTHKSGVRYPITSFFNFQATFPPSYQEQMKIWEEEGEL